MKVILNFTIFYDSFILIIDFKLIFINFFNYIKFNFFGLQFLSFKDSDKPELVFRSMIPYEVTIFFFFFTKNSFFLLNNINKKILN